LLFISFHCVFAFYYFELKIYFISLLECYCEI